VLRYNAVNVVEAQKDSVEGTLADLKTALNGNDIDAIRSAHEKLMGASQAFSQALYEKAAQENAAGTSASGQTGGATGGDDDIIDAEIVDEN
jgi:molecular chaperone DnaK